MKYRIFLLLLSFFYSVAYVSAAGLSAGSDDAKNRDAERIKTLKTISITVEQYYQDNAHYPSTRKELATALSTYANLQDDLDDPLAGKK